jgi:hypothetical protein
MALPAVAVIVAEPTSSEERKNARAVPDVSVMVVTGVNEPIVVQM